VRFIVEWVKGMADAGWRFGYLSRASMNEPEGKTRVMAYKEGFGPMPGN
jgi:hypothetical protein